MTNSCAPAFSTAHSSNRDRRALLLIFYYNVHPQLDIALQHNFVFCIVFYNFYDKMIPISKNLCNFAAILRKFKHKAIIGMKKIRAAVVGYGNIGRYALQALESAPDFEIAGIVRRNGAENKPAELASYEVVKDIRELKDVDVAILATPTRSCEEYAKQILPLGINTVDSFDIHTMIRDYRRNLLELNKQTNTVSVIAAGWDPGSESGT